MNRLLVGVVTVCALFGCQKRSEMRCGDLVLATRGGAALPVVVPVQSSSTVQYAAEEWRDYIRKATGTEVAILTNATCAALRIEQDRTMGDAFKLTEKDGSLTVLGGEKGVLYGVYELLERFAGVSWVAVGQEVVPRCERIVVPPGFSFSDKPAIEVRDTAWATVAYNPEFAARMRLNGAYSVAKGKFGEREGLFDWQLRRCHTMAWLVPDSLFETHPEYFALANGKRQKSYGQVCITNPGLRRHIREKVVRHIREVRAKNPRARYFGISYNDGYEGICQCEECLKDAERHGSRMGSLLTLINEIADEIAPEFPDVYLQTLSYLFTREPPKDVKPRRNVMICFCTANCEFSKPLTESRCRENAQFVNDIRVWRKMTDRLEVWDYGANFAWPLHVHPNVRALAANIRFFAENGVADLFEEGCPKIGADSDLKAYLVCKLMWNPHQDVDALVRRFTDGFFGAAAPYAREVYAQTEALPRDETEKPMTMMADLYDQVIPDSYFEKAAAIWAKAAEVVRDDPRCLSNVTKQVACLSATRILRYAASGTCGAVFVSRHPENVDPVKLSEMQRLAVECRKTLGAESVVSQPTSKYGRVFEQVLAAKAPTGACDSAEIEEDLFNRVPVLFGGIADDPAAGNGKAIRLGPTATQWGAVSYRVGEAVVDKGVRYRLRGRIRAEKEPDAKDGPAFRWCVFDYANRKVPVPEREIACSQIADDAYQWYDLGTWQPSAGDRLCFWTGKWNGAAPYKAVWIDKLILERAE